MGEIGSLLAQVVQKFSQVLAPFESVEAGQLPVMVGHAELDALPKRARTHSPVK